MCRSGTPTQRVVNKNFSLQLWRAQELHTSHFKNIFYRLLEFSDIKCNRYSIHYLLLLDIENDVWSMKLPNHVYKYMHIVYK